MKEDTLDTKSLMLFKHLSECKSVQQTAVFFNIPQSSVSYHITRLENYLDGIKLFDRTTRPMKLTKEGLQFYQEVEQLLPRIIGLKNNLITMSQHKEVNLGCFPSIIYDVSCALNDSDEFDTIRLKSGGSNTNLELMRNNELDMTLYLGANSVIESEFTQDKVGEMRLACIYPKDEEEISDIHQLSEKYDYIKLSANGTDLLVKRYLIKKEIHLKAKIEIEMANLIVALAEKLKAWSVISVCSGQHFLTNNLLKRVNYFYLDDFKPLPIYLVSQQNVDSAIRKKIVNSIKALLEN